MISHIRKNVEALLRGYFFFEVVWADHAMWTKRQNFFLYSNAKRFKDSLDCCSYIEFNGRTVFGWRGFYFKTNGLKHA